MQIALYGGSFNPPHLAHQLTCATVLAAARPSVDEVWVVPTLQHAFDKPLAPFADRFAMCERAMRIFGDRVRINRIEEELGGASYTLRTVKALRAKYPHHALRLVIGSDLVSERARWHGWEELVALVPFLVIGRAGRDEAPLAPGDHRVPIDLPDVSSTEARRRIADDEPTEGLLDEEVARYVAARSLYRAA